MVLCMAACQKDELKKAKGYTITGRLTDGAQPLPNIQIDFRLEDVDGKNFYYHKIGEARTDANGRYTFSFDGDKEKMQQQYLILYAKDNNHFDPDASGDLSLKDSVRISSFTVGEPYTYDPYFYYRAYAYFSLVSNKVPGLLFRYSYGKDDTGYVYVKANTTNIDDQAKVRVGGGIPLVWSWGIQDTANGMRYIPYGTRTSDTDRDTYISTEY